jgi:capsular polysaccharide biosynthesis protein
VTSGPTIEADPVPAPVQRPSPGRISLTELTSGQHGLGAVPAPVVLWDAALAAAPAPLTVLGPDRTGRTGVNKLRLEAGPIMCRFLCDVTLAGSGYLFFGSDLIVDGSELSRVAEAWVASTEDSPVTTPPAAETWVEELAIVAIAPGHLIYGHWLLDFIPRLMVAREVLGLEFESACIALPHDTPRWALSMIEAFTGAAPRQFRFYRRGTERLALRRACVPSYVHTEYAFHPYAQSVYASLGVRPDPGAPRRLCISRATAEKATDGQLKTFESRLPFETAARRRGYTVIQPERLTIREQAALFAGASHVIGEFGSGLHTTVFGPAGQRVGYIRCPSPIQFRISALRRQPGIAFIPEEETLPPWGRIRYGMTAEEIETFLDVVEG